MSMQRYREARENLTPLTTAEKKADARNLRRGVTSIVVGLFAPTIVLATEMQVFNMPTAQALIAPAVIATAGLTYMFSTYGKE